MSPDHKDIVKRDIDKILSANHKKNQDGTWSKKDNGETTSAKQGSDESLVDELIEALIEIHDSEVLEGLPDWKDKIYKLLKKARGKK